MTVELPEHVEEVRVLRVQPGDVVIVTVPTEPDQGAIEHIVDEMKRLFPDNESVVMCGGIELSVGRTT